MVVNIALTPEHCLDSKIAVAGCRAGELGILDLGVREAPEAIASAIDELATLAGVRGEWGVRWDTQGQSARGAQMLASSLTLRAPVLILAGLDLGGRGAAHARKLAAQFHEFRELAARIFVEARDLSSAQAAAALGCDGLVMKAHEAGGRVGRRSAFMLLQEISGKLDVPYWVQGGIGLHSAAAAVLAGAAGVALREQLWLADESPLAAGNAKAWAQLDGSETTLLAGKDGPFRLFARSGRDKLQELETASVNGDGCDKLLRRYLLQTDDPLIPMGQDIAFAGLFARRYGTVGRILGALRESIDKTIDSARAQKCLAPGSALASLHGTRFPVVQGPMTRVSDTASFAQAVAEGGALPFVALSVLRKPQAEALLRETRDLLGNQPWGVGILGFAPLELRREQLEAIRDVRPPFAIIGGGRPSQARELEALGVASYLHVPSPGLLVNFLEDGARKFIFEGNECGGHTGPRTSFILWELAIETLAAAKLDDPSSVAVLFAGGVHDALSAAMASAMAAPLAARGMKIGVVMGTAYLFTDEIVRSGALVKEFQTQAIACRETELLQSGAGLFTRCAHTPFCDEFNRVRRELILAGASKEDIIHRLEMLNIGRLRIASKGLAQERKASAQERKAEGGRRKYVEVDLPTQRREGLYMLGEAATFKTASTTIAALHRDVCESSLQLLDAVAPAPRPKARRQTGAGDRDIAIIGMASLLPGAADVRSYWRNIIRGVDAVREVSEDRWSPVDLYDPERTTPDKVYSKWGGFLDDVQFDPTRYGIPPASLSSIEPMQLLALEVARRAVEDAGLDKRPFPRERTVTIYGAGGIQDLGMSYIFRTELPRYLRKVPGLDEATRRQIVETLQERELPKWTEDSFPGFLGNVVAGRVANRLDLGGMNFTVDAACASSFAALQEGVRQLRDHDADVALIGAVDGMNNSVSFMAFAQTHALSPHGHCRPFDDSADGIAIGEGVAVLVLKRLSDAERDGDRIRAVIKGIGGSSDGRNKSLTAPHPQGQVAALQRAYRDAGVEPATIELIEAHGTGTAVGDKSEIESLRLAFSDESIAKQSCAIGSVKSMIGHTKIAAGLAGVIKSVLALEHQTLPPTIGVQTPNKRVDFAQTPFYISAEARPWLASAAHPRRCGVSAFGFGGANFHVVLEEYRGGYREEDKANLHPRDAELFTFVGATREDVREAAARLLREIEPFANLDLAQLAHARHLARAVEAVAPAACRLAILAASPSDLTKKLAIAIDMLTGGTARKHPGGVYIGEGAAPRGSVCFLFPGQGSQRVDMLRDMVVGLPELHEIFERADALLADSLPQKLSRYVYPVPAFNDADRQAQRNALSATQIAQPALGVVELAALEALSRFGVEPDFVAGHSYGEYVALCAAGVIGPDDLIRLSDIRGRVTAEAGAAAPGTMAAVNADGARVAELVRQHDLRVTVANLNSPEQTLIAGSAEDIEAAASALRTHSLRVVRLPIGTAFHSPAMAGAQSALAKQLANFAFRAPRIPVFSNTTAQRYPETERDIRDLLSRHIREPVRFVEEIDNLYAAGARIFIEVGPGQVMTGLAERILADRPHAALAIDAPSRPGWLQFGHLLAEAFALGCPVNVDRWFEGRGLEPRAPAEVLAQARAEAEPGPLIWRINGGRAEPWRKSGAPHRSAAEQSAGKSAAAETSSASASGDAVVAPNAAAFPAQAGKTPLRMRAEKLADEDRRHVTNAREPSQVEQIQRNIAQFIELQREQQETLRQFLDLQTRLLGTDVAGASAPAQTLAGVPPTPILPRLTPSAPATEQARAEPTARPAAEVAVPPRERQALEAVELSSTAQFKTDLLRAVSERTGYPEDMLDLDADMEADLGIDSIKRIEVFSELKNRYDFMAGRDDETVFDELAGLKTLNALIGWYDRLREGAPAQGAVVTAKEPAAYSAAAAEAKDAASASDRHPVERYVLKPVAAETKSGASTAASPMQAPILLLGPVSDASARLAAKLEKSGHKVRQATPGAETRALGGGRYSIDLGSATSVEEFRDLLAQDDDLPIGALISLLGLPDERASKEEAHLADARSLFVVAKVFESDLKEAAARGDGWLISLTALDGRFGLGGGGEFAPQSAGVHGVVKSIGREWPGIRTKCVDVDPAMTPDAIAKVILTEWRNRESDSAVEIGVTQEGRWRLELQPDPAGKAELSELDLDRDSVLLVTGGARGVTAAVTLALAKRCQPRIVIVGSSQEPEEEPAATRDIADPEALKRFLIDDLRRGGARKVTPAEVERVVEGILKNREIHANLAEMRASGAVVDYHAVDVRDVDAFDRLIDDIYAKWGRIEGVIHGAGIIEDKRTREKTVESFDAVYATKVTPALALSRKLRPEFLKFVAFFSSVAGRFGNAGQVDYSAANEVLNKLADRLSQEWLHVHVVAINWGPWGGGMANEQVLKLMARRNIHPIPVDVGARFCLEELSRRNPREAEVVVTASLEQIGAVKARKPESVSQPQKTLAVTDAHLDATI